VIDQRSDDGLGWARFSDDMTMRFRLARSLDGRQLVINEPGVVVCVRCVTFLLLNPTKANAFQVDPTVTRCRGFALALGADVYQVANIDALCSTDPAELYKRAAGFRGDDEDNNREILLACTGAHRVIAGWGVHGELGRRGDVVRALLATHQIALHHLGLTRGGHPRHPLYLKGGTEPQEWTLS